MESRTSVSKGVFLFPNGFKKQKGSKKKTATALIRNVFSGEPWYKTHKINWDNLEQKLKELHHNAYSCLLNNVVAYIKGFYMNNESFMMEGIIPSATLVTGVNQSDHISHFDALIKIIGEEVTQHIAIVSSQDAPTVKHLIENVVWQLINGHKTLEDLDEDLENTVTRKKILKKNQCTMKALHNWYHNKYFNISPKKRSVKRSLVIIVPDFESFNCSLLQDFVMIVSSYISSLPILLVFGVATSVSALHKSFPYHVSAKLLIKVFHSYSSPMYMNQVLEEIFLTHTSPFHLSGKVIELLTDVFIFYDFSVTGFIQSVKYCMMEHYFADNSKSLCCSPENLKNSILKLNSEDLENIRQLMSFRPFLEEQEPAIKISLFEDDDFFKRTLLKKMNDLHDYMYSFYLCVRLLSTFVKDMPKNSLGKSNLLKATRLDKIQSKFEMVRSRFISYLEEMFRTGLQPPHTQPFHEILFFTDVAGVKKQIVGSPRGAIHMALSNPIYYLQCNCCYLPSSDSVIDTLPDVCLAYKLHRECGKHINLYDWLQAFAAILKPGEDDDQRQQDPTIQLRFTRAVAELQFLGFVKSSKRKTDHVMRLTW